MVEDDFIKRQRSDVNRESEVVSHGDYHENFRPSQGLTTEEATRLLAKWGRNEIVEKKDPYWLVFLQLLFQPMPCMIWIAIIVEGAIENWPDFGILMGIQFLNASLSFYETTKAGNAVAALKKSLKPLAEVKRDGRFVEIDAALLVPGDLVTLGLGKAVPADCVVNHGQVDIDQSALTGESLPVTMFPGNVAKMGSNVIRGETTATVEATGENSFFGKTAKMLQGGNEVSNLQKVLMKIMVILVVLSLTLAGIILGYLLGHKYTVRESLSFVVVLIVASIPVAIEIVCTTTLALGSRELSKEGAIVAQLAAIEDLAGMNMLCSDKTGTLTKNEMVIQEETPLFGTYRAQGLPQKELLKYAALAAKWEELPKDALDRMVLGTGEYSTILKDYERLDHVPFDPTVKRTESTIRDPKGAVYKVTKGAPHVLLQLVHSSFEEYKTCNPSDPMNESQEKEIREIDEQVEDVVDQLGLRGIRSLAVARTRKDKKGWEMIGLLTFLDPPREDTRDTIHRAMAYGVDVKMITGDHLLIARETARVLGMGMDISDPSGLPMLDKDGKAPKDLIKYAPLITPANGFAQVYPEHKYLIVECLRRSGFKTGMTGDGVNDAPALKRADVGIAVSGATDAARLAADIVLTQPGLSPIVTGIVVARKIFARMKNFITYRIAATLQLLIFFFISVFAFHPDKELGPETITFHGKTVPEIYTPPPFFSMPVLMLMLITLLNDGTLISIGYDNVKPSAFPEKWNLRVLFTYAFILGSVSFISSLALLHYALDSGNPDGLFQLLGSSKLSYGEVTTIIYLKVSISDFLTLFSARTLDGPFWSAIPSPILMGAATLSLLISSLLAVYWPPIMLDSLIYAKGCGPHLACSVWVYCIICWFIQDFLKVVANKVMHKYNIFNINATNIGSEKIKEVAMEEHSSLPISADKI